VAIPNERERSFYLFKRLRTPKTSDEYWGIPPREGQKFSQAFEDILVDHMNLGDGKVLLVSDSYAQSGGLCSACFNTFAQPTLLLLKAVPESVWSSDGDVFIVPKQVLWPALDNQNHNVFTRYQAVLKAIGQETVARSAP
jgi:hypothetical protein